MEKFRRYFLSYKGIQTEIKEPIGFDGFKPKLSRGNSHGTIWEYSDLSIGFCGVGYDICKTAYSSEGIEADVILLVEEKFNNTWEEFYKGRLDFAQYVEIKGNAYTIELGVAQIDTQTVIRNRLETKVEIESLVGFEGNSLTSYSNLKKEISLEGKSVSTYSRVETGVGQGNRYTTTRTDLTYFNIVFVNDIKSELFELNAYTAHDGSFSDIEPLFIVPPGDISYKNIRIKADFNVFASFEATIPMVVPSVFYQINNDQQVDIGQFVGLGTDVQLDMIIDLNPGDKFYLYGVVYTNTAGEWGYEINPRVNLVSPVGKAFFEVSGVSKYKATNAKLSLVHESLSRVVESITNGEITVQSDYYSRTDSEINPTNSDGCGSLRGIVSGLNLRNGRLTDGSLPSTYISLKDFLDALSAIDCIGYGLQGNKLIVEPYKYFYTEEVIMSCKDVSNVERKVDLSRSFQLFNNGYKKWEAEEYNGIDGFHGKRQYRTSLKMSDTKLEKECSFIADGYAIEATRRRQIETDSKDWRYDNDIFVVCLQREDNNLITVDTGVLDTDGTVIDSDSIYNASISPARNAMRWYSWIMQGVKLDDELIFAGGEGYVKAKLETLGSCTIESSALIESQNIILSVFEDNNLPIPIFEPETVSFNYPITRDDFINIKSNPYGLIEFDGEYGWIKEIEFDLLKCMAKFQLIAKRN